MASGSAVSSSGGNGTGRRHAARQQSTRDGIAAGMSLRTCTSQRARTAVSVEVALVEKEMVLGQLVRNYGQCGTCEAATGELTRESACFPGFFLSQGLLISVTKGLPSDVFDRQIGTVFRNNER